MIKLADTLAPLADFPAAYAKDIEFDDGKNLQEKLNNGELGGGTNITVDSAMSDISTNPVQNKVIKEYVDNKSTNVSEIDGNAIIKKSDGLFVEDLSNKVNALNVAQKTVNSELEYYYATKTTSISGVSIKDSNLINYLSYLTNITSNLEPSRYNTKGVTLKKSKTYRITFGLARATTSGNGTSAYVMDSDGNKLGNRGYFGSNSYSDNIIDVIYTPTKDISVYPALVNLNTNLGSTYYPDCSFFQITEIGREVIIDPVEYVDSTKGIEDTPVGHIIPYMGNNAPKHYLICDGGEYNIVDYPYLAQHFTDEFGSVNYFGGDGTTTFAVPDLRGEFLRGTGVNSHANQGSGSNVGEHQDATEQLNLIGYNAKEGYLLQRWGDDEVISAKNIDKVTSTSSQWINYTNASIGPETSSTSMYSSRPTNTSVLYCIKYEPTYFMKNTYSADSVYSTDEMIIGRWIDGKPLYRKVIQGNITSKDQSLFVVNENVKTMISIYGYDSPDGIYYFPFNYTQNGSTQKAIFYKKDTDTIEFRSNSYNSGEVFVVILEYTKATD